MSSFLDKSEAANLLGVKVTEIDEMIRNKEIPHLRIGRNIRFRLSTIQKWAEESRKNLA
ncbi:helix-turn-helix domain-containing protein [Brevibacillus formosus]|uniref:helix-turn-helix domain-containing protein n=1 Tax=Brevibacillus formosus TaxID=54913 RepID=UPI0018CFE33A|nr:helix-turn-helix domain-containing protein [Brevibacillus formosus]